MGKNGLGLSELDLGYLAALIDTQGTLYISEEFKKHSPNPQHTLTVVVTLTDLQVLAFWRSKTGLGSLQRSMNRKNGTTWHWRINAHAAEALLKLVHGHLMIKREQARIALEFRGTYVKRNPQELLDEATIGLRRAFRQAMLDMNHAR